MDSTPDKRIGLSGRPLSGIMETPHGLLLCQVPGFKDALALGRCTGMTGNEEDVRLTFITYDAAEAIELNLIAFLRSRGCSYINAPRVAGTVLVVPIELIMVLLSFVHAWERRSAS